jgi:hypothetical protein
MRRAFGLVAVVLVVGAGSPEGLPRGSGHGAPVGRGVSAAGQDFVRPGETAPLPAALADAVASLNADRLAAHIAFLSAPSLGGRGLGSDGLEAAAEYAAAQLSLAGVAPALARTGRHPLQAYFQTVALREISQPGGRLTLSRRRGGATVRVVFRPGTDVLFPERAPQLVQGPAVFAGYGIREERPARDDYRGLDVRGKVVVLLGGLPSGAEWRTPELSARYDSEGRIRHVAKLALAGSLGAKAVVAIEDEAFAADLAKDSARPAPAFFMLAERETPPLPPVVRVTPEAGRQILAAASLTPSTARAAAPRVIAGVTVSLELTGRERSVESRNVVAVIPGGDPSRKEEAVVLGAHLDHLGRQGATYYPGADDNASGVAALLEIARAAAAGPRPPARTLVFAFWTAEEEGHWGAEHYCRHPAWPLARTTVYLNLDMIGHPWRRDEIEKLVADARLERGDQFLAAVDPARFIELGLAHSAADVGPVLLSAGRGVGLSLHLDRTDGWSGGSDYREFAWRGVKFVRFFGNYFEGYHEPADRIEALDPAQVLRVARLALASAWLLAENPIPRPSSP